MSKLNGPREENYYIQNKCKLLEDMLGKAKEIKEKIQKNIDKNLNSLEKVINDYIFWLKAINPGNKDSYNNMEQDYFDEDIRKNIKLFFDSVINIYFSENLNIIDYRKKFYDLFDEFINFDFSPYESSFITNSNLISSKDISFQYYDNQNSFLKEEITFNYLNDVERVEQNSSRHDTNDKCIECNFKKPSYSYLNKKYCKDCIIEIFNKMYNEGEQPNIDDIIYFDDKKDLFMNSLETLIKTILLKFNFILNNENHIRRNIYKKLYYPTIMSNEYRVSDVNFMKEINLVLINDFNADFLNFSAKDFNLFNLNGLIKESLKKIFNDKKILDDNKIDIIEDDNMSEEMIEIDVNNE